MKLTIATRKSQLALWQSEFVMKSLKSKYENLDISLQGYKTKGDIILDTPLAKIGGKGLFTKEIEEAILNDQAQLAVHSLKDVPSFFPKGLCLAAVCKREVPNDVLLSQKYKNLNELPKNATIGTTSLRRKMQLLILRPDLKIISLRGNINSRINKLKNNEFDAIVLAYAGITRLGFEKEINFIYQFSLDEMIPSASQGILGIESIKNNEILKILSCLNDEKALIASSIERDFIKELNGGCQAPIGINANIKDDKIELRAILGLPDGSKFLKEYKIILLDEAKNAGIKLAQDFINKGAKELLSQAERMI